MTHLLIYKIERKVNVDVLGITVICQFELVVRGGCVEDNLAPFSLRRSHFPYHTQPVLHAGAVYQFRIALAGIVYQRQGRNGKSVLPPLETASCTV